MHRIRTVMLLLMSVLLLVATASAFGGDEPPKPSIRLQKWQFQETSKGKGTLTLRFGNYSNRETSVSEIALTANTWTAVGLPIQAGKTLTLKYTIENAPAYVDVSTSVGKLHVELIPENESR
jgi:hypothetical protein